MAPLARAALLGAALVHSAAAQGNGVAVSGYGIKLPSEGLGQAEAIDVPFMVARSVGIEAPRSSRTEALPTSDIFSPAHACVVVNLEHLSVEQLLESAKEAPFLSSLFSSNGLLPLYGSQDQVSSALGMISELLEEESHLAYVKNIEEVAGDVLAKIPSAKIPDTSPDVFILEAASHSCMISKLDSSVEAAVSALRSSYSSKVAIVAVATGDAMFPARLLQTNDNSTNGTSPLVGDEFLRDAEVFLTLVWTSVVIAAFLLMTLCCIPWADELDPILYSGLIKDTETKQE